MGVSASGHLPREGKAKGGGVRQGLPLGGSCREATEGESPPGTQDVLATLVLPRLSFRRGWRRATSLTEGGLGKT